ncbi:MAG: MarC family protein [Lentisphaeria bacterium]|nr:MarC family protein [Lentisphaeria bacterium]
MSTISFLINQFLKFLFLLTPFFVLSMFLSMTQGWGITQKRRLALRVGTAAFVICTILIFCGSFIFQAFDITLDAFRIGGGAILFLSAVGLVNSNVTDKKDNTAPLQVEDSYSSAQISNIAVVPLAIPVTVGPGTIGAMLVIGAESANLQAKLLSLGAVAIAMVVLTTMLWAATWVEQKLGHQVIVILSKLTGLILAAMAAQMIFTGIKNFL